jgi:hypothetical protein
MGHPDVICQTIMNMPVQPSYTRKACKPWSFHRHHPISSHLVSCQPKHPSMLFFIFNSFVQLQPQMCLDDLTQTETIYSLWLVLPANAQKLLTRRTQPKCCCAFYHKPASSKSAVIVVYQSRPSTTPSLGTKNAIFEGRLFTSRSKNVKRVLNICCSDDEPNHEDSQGMIESTTTSSVGVAMSGV